jgi:hypothetical protein
MGYYFTPESVQTASGLMIFWLTLGTAFVQYIIVFFNFFK